MGGKVFLATVEIEIRAQSAEEASDKVIALLKQADSCEDVVSDDWEWNFVNGTHELVKV